MESSQVNKENEKNLKRAKEIFKAYNGSSFGMWKDDVLEEFESYLISEEEKICWKNELRDEYINKLSEETNELKSVHLLMDLESLVFNFKDEISYSTLVRYIKENINQFDSKNRIVIAGILLDAVKSMDKDHKEQETYDFAMQILKDVCERPITYAEYRYYNGKIPSGLNEQVIKERARLIIEEGKEFWGESPVKIAVESLTTGIKKFLSVLKRKR